MGSRGGSSGFLNGCRGRSHLDGDIQMEAWSRFEIFYVLHGEQTVEDKSESLTTSYEVISCNLGNRCWGLFQVEEQ